MIIKTRNKLLAPIINTYFIETTKFLIMYLGKFELTQHEQDEFDEITDLDLRKIYVNDMLQKYMNGVLINLNK